jgi:hypothetical protein
MSREKIYPQISADVLYSELVISDKGNDFDIILPDENEFSVLERSFDKATKTTRLKIGRVSPVINIVWGFKTEAHFGGENKVFRVNGQVEVELPLVKVVCENIPSDVFDYSATELGKAKTLYAYANNGSGLCEYIRKKIAPAFKSSFEGCVKELDKSGAKTVDTGALIKRFSEEEVFASLKRDFFAQVKDVSVFSVTSEKATVQDNGIKRAIDTFLPSVFAIRTNGSQGTGFVFDMEDGGCEFEKVKTGGVEKFVGEDGELYDKEPTDKKLVTHETLRLYGITCRHVLYDENGNLLQNAKAVLNGGVREYEIKVAECSNAIDVAVFTLCVPKDMIGAVEKIDIHLDKKSIKEYETKEIDQGNKPKVVLLGNELGAGINAIEGDLVSITYKENDREDKRMFRTNVLSNQGCSGGPVFDEDGRCIGILTKRLQSSGKSLVLGWALATSTYNTDNRNLIISLKDKLEAKAKSQKSGDDRR